MEVGLEAFVERILRLEAPPEAVREYYQGNEELFGQLVGRERLVRLADRRYRVQTRGFGAFGLEVTPSFEVQFTDHADRTVMTCRDFHFAHTASGAFDAAAAFEGEACFEPDGAGTALRCWTRAQAHLVLPGMLRLVPRAVVEGVLQSLMHTAMEAMALRFEGLIARDFPRWYAERGPEA